MEATLENRGSKPVIGNDAPLDADDVAAFLDGRLEGDELARVEAYLAANPTARQELIKAARILSSVPEKKAKSRRRYYPAAGLAAAAVLAIVIFNTGNDIRRTSAPVSNERRGIADEPGRIQVVFPGDRQQITGDTPRFAWRAVAGATSTALPPRGH